MKNRRISLIIVICTLALWAFSACSSGSATVTKSGMEETVNFLTSKACDGRLVGSSGNEKAAEYIKSSFESLGLVPYRGDSFGVAYEQRDAYDPDNCNLDLKFFISGEWKTAEPGVDYIPTIRADEVSGEYDIVGSETDFSQKALLLGKNDSAGEYIGKNSPALFLTLSSGMMLTRPSMDTVPTIRLTESGYGMATGAEKVAVNISTPIKTVCAENIVGMIPGKDSSKAVVVSAHFDHVGSVGEVIYPGGHDDASGVAVMLRIAQLLTEKAETPAADVIFCAFNGEENAQQGSSALVPELASKYSMLWGLNIDCVGSPDSPKSYTISSDAENDPLVDEIAFKLKLSELESKYADLGSDHLAYSQVGSCAVTVGQDNCDIHIPEDDGEDLNYEEMETLANALSEFVYVNAAREFIPEEQTVNLTAPSFKEFLEQNSKANEALETALNGQKLAYDEEIYFMVDDACYVMQGSAPLYGIEEVRKYHPDLDIPETFAELPLESVYLADYVCSTPMPSQYNRPKQPELNKIMKRSLQLTENSSITLVYREGTREITVKYGNYGESPDLKQEKLSGEYEGFQLYYEDYSGNPYYYQIFVPLEGYRAMIIEMLDTEIVDKDTLFVDLQKHANENNQNLIYVQTGTGANAVSKAIYDCGNNTREGIMEIVGLVKIWIGERQDPN